LALVAKTLTFFSLLTFWQSGFKHFSNLGNPYICALADLERIPCIIYFSYFARDDIFVRAVSVREHDSSGILQDAHMDAVFCACAVVRLINCPRQVVREGDAIHTCAPRPLALAAARSAAGPVVQVKIPPAFTQTNYFNASTKDFFFFLALLV
jgi:hypothetical protein